MASTVISNPIINTPYAEPTRHFRFDDDGITDEIIEGRRPSSYFLPIAKPKKTGQATLPVPDWTGERVQETKEINDIRRQVSIWRRGGYAGVTPVTRSLLQYWTNEERERRFFFCQIEALETAIYLTEAARKYGDAWIENFLRDKNNESNPGLPRVAFKMATGSGKTVVMAMLIAWQALNKLAYPQDSRFSDAFLVITPGITIRDRLQVLLPSDPHNYYRELDILPAHQMQELGRAKIVITNFHAFKQREKINAGKLTKTILEGDKTGAFTESPGEMVRRVCRELGTKKNIVVLNDEAHHCYRHRPEEEPGVKLTGEEKTEAKQRNDEARIWISGVEAVKQKLGVRTIYDLSATPFFLRGSGYPEGTLFGWVVSDFSLVDAIESGIVKVPRVPVNDNALVEDDLIYRNLWPAIRDDLPKKGKKTEKLEGEPHLPAPLQGALHSLYSNYARAYERWAALPDDRRPPTPPVFIVVCNNTNVSNLVYRYISGWDKVVGDEVMAQAGAFELFRNDDGRGGWIDRPRTILVDSAQLDSGDAMTDEFKAAAAREIREFKEEYRRKFPGKDVEKITDEDLLREVMNTVGKPGRLGEGVQCVVSVSMLTEGWDANTVTHILGVRAFGTQLLCEQVVGRALRRQSYAVNDEGYFPTEYAEVYGVPFSFIPTGGVAQPETDKAHHRVRALEERIALEITFPRLLGYRYEIPDERLSFRFTEESQLALTTRDIPTKVVVAPIVGEQQEHTLEDLRAMREGTLSFLLAKRTLQRYFVDAEGTERPWLFPQLLSITRAWLAQCLTLQDDTFPQLLLLHDRMEDAVDRIYHAVVRADDSPRRLIPTMRPYDPVGSTRYVDYDTTKPVYEADPEKCHVNFVVADTDSWEQKMAQTLEEMDEVQRYVKNAGLMFTIPYTIGNEQHQYLPDFIACIDDGHGPDDLLHLIIEVTGEKKRDKAAKVDTARTLWVPAVNNHGGFGRWAFVEVSDPWDAAATIRAVIRDRHDQLAAD